MIIKFTLKSTIYIKLSLLIIGKNSKNGRIKFEDQRVSSIDESILTLTIFAPSEIFLS
jgi:hypothetical protein